MIGCRPWSPIWFNIRWPCLRRPALLQHSRQRQLNLQLPLSSPPAAKLGLIDNLSRPSGNITGATQLNVELGPKRLELLHELLPTATIVALLVNPTNPVAETLSREMEASARTL